MSVRLFVGNLAFGVTETEVRELFSAAGTVSQVRLPTDRETGKPRGFAFVDFDDRAQAEAAITRFNQYMFKERMLAVNEARAREARPAGGPGAPQTSRPRPAAAPRPNWSGPMGSDPEDAPEATSRPKRTFGPDANARDKRRQKGRASREERRPKGPLRERGGGQLFFGADGDDDDDDDDQVLDNFTLWAREDAENKDKE